MLQASLTETNNSRSKENQALWDKKINQELEDL